MLNVRQCLLTWQGQGLQTSHMINMICSFCWTALTGLTNSSKRSDTLPLFIASVNSKSAVKQILSCWQIETTSCNRSWFYLSCCAQGKVFPTEVRNDSCCKGVTKNVDHGTKPVTAERRKDKMPQDNLTKDWFHPLKPVIFHNQYLQDPINGYD